VKHELLTRNPFVGLAVNTRPNRTRDHFVTRDEAVKIIDACPDAEWRLIVALCRFAGLRCPTEVLALRWGDVLWDQHRMTIPNVKTGKTTDESFRTLPLFPEVRQHLEDVFALAPEGAEYVVTRYRDANANLRTQLARTARTAGVAMWDKHVREHAGELRHGTGAVLPGLRRDRLAGAFPSRRGSPLLASDGGPLQEGGAESGAATARNERK
jgi:integrase